MLRIVYNLKILLVSFGWGALEKRLLRFVVDPVEIPNVFFNPWTSMCLHFKATFQVFLFFLSFNCFVYISVSAKFIVLINVRLHLRAGGGLLRYACVCVFGIS